MALAHAPYATAAACQHKRCDAYEIGEDAYCEVCTRALCRQHYDCAEHKCRYTFVDEIVAVNSRSALRDDLDPDAITNRMHHLRPGHKCTLQLPDDLLSLPLNLVGSLNLHIVVTFDDGVEWLIRLTGYPLGPVPARIGIRTLESEALTYEVLGGLDGLPVAKLHDWGTAIFSRTKNPYCVYLVYDGMLGEPCTSKNSLLAMGEVDDERMRSFANQYAAASIQISSLKFDAIGSLALDKEGTIIVGNTVASPWYDDRGNPKFGGPFRSLRDRYLFAINEALHCIRAGQMHRAGPLLPYLIYLELHRQVSASAVLGAQQTEFYLAHADTLAHNIMATSHKLTAIVDWEWAGTTTKAAAFALPGWAGRYQDGSLDRGGRFLHDAYIQAGRPDLADCVRDGGLYERLELILMDPTPCDRPADILLGLLNEITLRSGQDDPNHLPATLRDWGRNALQRHKMDSHLGDVIELDRILRETRKPAPEAEPKEYEKRPKQWHYEDFVSLSSSPSA